MSRFDGPPRGQAKGIGGLRDVWAVLNKFFKGGFFQLSPDTIRGRASKAGTGTIVSTTTSVVVTHGAAYTPSLNMIRITWGENPTNDPGNWWISSITSTQFTVNVRNDPGASGLDFGWAVDPL